MHTMAALVVYVVLALAICVVVLNWGCVIASIRMRRQGLPRHVSTVPLVAQVLVGLALFLSMDNAVGVPNWVYGCIALADPALYSLLYLPIFLLRRRYLKKTTERQN